MSNTLIYIIFIALLKCNDGTLLKIFQDGDRGHHEVEFYSNIFSTKQDPNQIPDQVTYTLRQFIPKYFGTVAMKNDGKSRKIFLIATTSI